MTGTNLLKVPADQVEIPFSILDTDLYKLTMQYAVLHHFPDAVVRIKFTNRNPQKHFSRESFAWIQAHVKRLETLALTPDERAALHATCPYFPDRYLDYLSSVRLDPRNQVNMSFVPKSEDGMMGEIECEINGLWKECILYEVPIMSIMSESYFLFVDTDWNLDGQKERAKKKGLAMLQPPSGITPLAFSEFGTRRRRSFQTQDLVMRGLIEAQKEYRENGGTAGALLGSSNVYLALKYGLKPVGTIAHEWIMAIGSVHGYKGVNGRAMDMWEEVYPRGDNAAILTMLTDTFTATAFFTEFTSDPQRALRWEVLRQDSGDPYEFLQQAKEAWRVVEEKGGIKHADGVIGKGKKVIFSDGLDVDSATALQRKCHEVGIAGSYGIGTSLSNDFHKASDPSQPSKALNIVIKLNRINGKDCVKLSDDVGKYTGNVEEVKRVQRELGLPAEHEAKRRG